MDRSILEGDPHSVIEAMLINGYAVEMCIRDRTNSADAETVTAIPKRILTLHSCT